MKRKRLEPISPSTRFAEAFHCRINRIQTEWAKNPVADRKPDIDLQLATLLGQIEKILGIEYDTNTDVSHSSRPMCSVCRLSYSRPNDLNDHIKSKHGYLQQIFESVTCYSCCITFDTHRQLVLHEKTVHRAIYQSRLDFLWPGFTQPDSEEMQNSFLYFLGGDSKKQKIGSSLRAEASASSPTTFFPGSASNSNPAPHIDHGANTPDYLRKFDESDWYDAHSFLPTDEDPFDVDNFQLFTTLMGEGHGEGHDSFMQGGTGS